MNKTLSVFFLLFTASTCTNTQNFEIIQYKGKDKHRVEKKQKPPVKKWKKDLKSMLKEAKSDSSAMVQLQKLLLSTANETKAHERLMASAKIKKAIQSSDKQAITSNSIDADILYAPGKDGKTLYQTVKKEKANATKERELAEKHYKAMASLCTNTPSTPNSKDKITGYFSKLPQGVSSGELSSRKSLLEKTVQHEKFTDEQFHNMQNTPKPLSTKNFAVRALVCYGNDDDSTTQQRISSAAAAFKITLKRIAHKGYQVVGDKHLKLNTRADVDKKIDNLINYRGVENKIGVFYFCGHGKMLQNGQQLIRLSKDTKLNIEEVAKKMTATFAYSIIFIDACSKVKENDRELAQYKVDPVHSDKLTVVCSSSPGSASWITKGESLFTKSLCQAIKSIDKDSFLSDLIVNVEELMKDKSDQTPYIRRLGNCTLCRKRAYNKPRTATEEVDNEFDSDDEEMDAEDEILELFLSSQ